MPIVSLDQAINTLQQFEQDYLDITQDSTLTLKKRKHSMSSSNNKINRWKGFIEKMKENGETAFKYRFSGVYMTSEVASKNGKLSRRPPSQFTEEELKEKAREYKRNWARKNRLKKSIKNIVDIDIITEDDKNS